MPAPYDYRDKWVGKYACNVSIFEWPNPDTPYVSHYFIKDTILVRKSVANDSAVDVTGEAIDEFNTIYINKLGVGAPLPQPIKFYSNDSIYIYLVDGGYGYYAWGLGSGSEATFIGKKLN